MAILLSHRRTQIKCADSVIGILYRRFLAASGRPLPFLKLARPPPSIAPSDVGRSSLYFRFHREFAWSHVVFLSIESHSVIMCSKVSYLLQRGHSALIWTVYEYLSPGNDHVCGLVVKTCPRPKKNQSSTMAISQTRSGSSTLRRKL